MYFLIKMGQEEVKKVLEKERGWLISNEIAKKAGYSLKSIQSSLRRLVKWRQIEKKPASKVIGDEKRLKDRSFAGYAYKIKEFKTISDQNFSDKKVLLLTDFQSIKTIKDLCSQPDIKLVILPHTKKKDLFKYSDTLSSKLNKRITFIENIFSKDTEEKLKKIKSGQIFLLDNIRKLKEETKENNPKKHSNSDLVKALAPHFDLFVMDAFSIASKAYASTVGFTYVLPTLIGKDFEDNISKLDEFKNAKNGTTFVLGGEKSEHLIKLMEKNYKKSNTFLLTGLFSHLCLEERGIKLGNHDKLLDKRKIKSNKPLKNMLKDSENIITPEDLALSTLGNRDEVKLKDFPAYQTIYDLGEKTINYFSKAILDSKVVFFKGLPGNYKEENFHNGTESLLKALQETKADVYIIGEETVDALQHFNIDTKNFKLVSKNSETVFKYLNDGSLPILNVLKEKL